MTPLDCIEIALGALEFLIGLVCIGLGLRVSWFENWLNRFLQRPTSPCFDDVRNWVVAAMVAPLWTWALIYFADGLGHPLPTEWARWLDFLAVATISLQVLLIILNGRLLALADLILDRWNERNGWNDTRAEH